MTAPTGTAERIIALLDHLGIARAHFATQMPHDLASLARIAPSRMAGVVLCVPTRLDPTPFAGLASRLLLIAGDKGLTVGVVGRAVERLPGAHRHVLADYEAMGWSDVVADRTAEVVDAMVRCLDGVASDAAPAAPSRRLAASGEHAGLTFRIEGDGPPLVLLPFFLAPSQWDPAVAALAERFTVIRLGGPHIGGMAALEDRASAPTYRAMLHTLADLLEVGPGARVLDVGCGSGALDRILARRLPDGARIDAMDLNPFFVSEARALAEREGVADRIVFSRGSALDIPFPDASFEAAFSVTVLEECDADRALAEMVRVVRPGARIGVVVRAIDVGQWWNIDVPPALAAKAGVPPQSVAPGGVADRSLYRRMRQAGLVDLVPFPAMITIDRPGGPIWRYREDAVLPQLTPDETISWTKASERAAADGLLLHAHVLHAAVARKPAG
ncbi:MAG: methyltransferase domain-containing protein [Hyphomicrobiaceae bacterium]